MSKEWLLIKEAAERLGTGIGAIYIAIRKGRLKPVPEMLERGLTVFTPAEVERYRRSRWVRKKAI